MCVRHSRRVQVRYCRTLGRGAQSCAGYADAPVDGEIRRYVHIIDTSGGRKANRLLGGVTGLVCQLTTSTGAKGQGLPEAPEPGA